MPKFVLAFPVHSFQRGVFSFKPKIFCQNWKPRSRNFCSVRGATVAYTLHQTYRTTKIDSMLTKCYSSPYVIFRHVITIDCLNTDIYYCYYIIHIGGFNAVKQSRTYNYCRYGAASDSFRPRWLLAICFLSLVVETSYITHHGLPTLPSVSIATIFSTRGRTWK